MEIPIDTARRRWALLTVSILVGALMFLQAVRFWLADYRMRSSRIALMVRGAALVPGNGEAWDRIGRFYQLDFENPDLSRAIQAYQLALRDDPNSPYYWMDLSSAYEDAGDYVHAREAFERAEAAYPISALVTWMYGNFLIRRQDYSQGYKKVRQAVTVDPKLLSLAISRTWRATEDVNSLLDQALPANIDAYLEALTFFAGVNQPDAGLAVWERLVWLRKPFPLSKTFAFLDMLIANDRAHDVDRVWSDALAADGIPHEFSPKHSLVSNGDFAQDFLNGGLGWRWYSPPGVSISLDPPPPSRPGRSVRLDFNGGSNPDLNALRQYVPVEPSSMYHFHAYMRTDQITTDSGLRFWITDPNHSGAVNGFTDDFTGSHPWTPIDMDLTSGPQTHFLFIQLIRYPSRLFENKLGGTAWIGDVTLISSVGSTE